MKKSGTNVGVGGVYFFISTVEFSLSILPSSKLDLFIVLAAYLTDTSILKINVVRSFETSINFYQIHGVTSQKTLLSVIVT
jgi:hypothetical protein